MPKTSTLLYVFGFLLWMFSPMHAFAETWISADQALEQSKAQEIVLIDIRSPSEWKESGLAETAVALSMHERGFLEGLEKIRTENPGKEIALICATGGRTAFIQRELERRNLGTVIDVSEGMFGNPRGKGWIAKGLPVKKWDGK